MQCSTYKGSIFFLSQSEEEESQGHISDQNISIDDMEEVDSAEKNLTESKTIPVLAIRDSVFYPGDIPPIVVGREKSLSALQSAVASDNKILLLTQKSAYVDDPTPEQLYDVGVIAEVLQIIKLPDNTAKLLTKVETRAQALDFHKGEKFISAIVEAIDDIDYDSQNETEIEALKRSLIADFQECIKLSTKINPEANSTILKLQDQGASRLADAITSHLEVKIESKQLILETFDVHKRLIKVYELLKEEIGVLDTEQKIRQRVKSQMENTQRVYYLNEQLKAIQKELGDNESSEDSGEIAELEKKINKTPLSKEARDEALNEIKKLKMMTPMSAEASVIRNYLDWLLCIPWEKKARLKTDLKFASSVLEKNHHGMTKVKERILEYLAVHKRTKKIKGPILCLVGPPGVGKTSLAGSIAQATGRDFLRISLGGVKDESEIRGHRRTYIGSMPGKIIQCLKKAKTSNPLFLLDEIDKMISDIRGDPYSALLEVLDSEHNKYFVDHYLGVEYNLSNIMFVATANSTNLPSPLLDRMEIIFLDGYTEEEKFNIAKSHILPSIMKDHCINENEWSISQEGVYALIRNYTKESGVRNLKRELATLIRKAIKKIFTSDEKNIVIGPDNLSEYLGPKQYEFGVAEKEDSIGAVTGLAYTQVGGELLTIEAVKVPGEGKISSTGKLGDVMKESIQAAHNCLYSKCKTFGIEPEEYKKWNIHIHVPQGAVPKDGPSAGVGMFTAIVSLMTNIPVSKEVAMTGEVTLRGMVLPIGGLKEKLLAAHRGGIKKVIIPEENEKDLQDIPDAIKNQLSIIPVKNVDLVLDIALTSKHNKSS